MSELYKKYRPKTFKDMVGNFEPLEKVVSSPNCPHAFLFTGPSGCGKTTAGRIIKEMLGCDDMDYHEFNTANTRGIDTIRGIIDSLPQTSFTGGPVIYIIDEAHALTSDAQNALLKPLEDTPSHVYFILCTSEPSKIIKAIQTRCYAVTFSTIPDEYMTDLVFDVSEEEGVKLSGKVVKKIVKVANGSARKALVVLDQILSTTPENYDKILSDNDSVVENAEVIELCRMVYETGVNSGMNELLSKLKAQGEEPEKIRRSILGYGTALLLNPGSRARKAILENMEPFLRNTYDTGFAGIAYACNKAECREVF